MRGVRGGRREEGREGEGGRKGRREGKESPFVSVYSGTSLKQTPLRPK